MTTIAALATPPGLGGIAVIRVSGDKAFLMVDRIFVGSLPVVYMNTHTIHYGKIVNPFIRQKKSELVDTVTVAVFRAPKSYTGEDIVEISCHGGNMIAGMILDLLYRCGVSPAAPGEYTRRAFINGKMDLPTAESVADLIHAISTPGARAAVKILEAGMADKIRVIRSKIVKIVADLETELDFLDSDLPGIDRGKVLNDFSEMIIACKKAISCEKNTEILRNGYRVAIVGKTNSGKSTLFNALLDRNRALVSNSPGTTRDFLEDCFYINNIPIRLVDTAGLNAASRDVIEIEGIKLTEQIIKTVNLIILLVDGTKFDSVEVNSMLASFPPDTEVLVAVNKVDLMGEIRPEDYPHKTWYPERVELPGLYPDGPACLVDPNKKHNTDSDSYVYISAKTGLGIDTLTSAILKTYMMLGTDDGETYINARQAELLRKSTAYLESARDSFTRDLGNEVVILDLRTAADALGNITGDTFNDEVLDEIFSKFCIGK